MIYTMDKEHKGQSVEERRRELIASSKAVLKERPEGMVIGDTLVRYETREVEEASSFYVLEGHNLLIPVVDTSGDTFSLVASAIGDWDLPEKVAELPRVDNKVGKMLQDTLGYTVLPVLTECLVTQPVKTLSPMQREALQAGKKRRATASKLKQYPKGTINLDF